MHGEPLPDYTTERQTDDVHRVDPQLVEQRQHIPREFRYRVSACDRIGFTVRAVVDRDDVGDRRQRHDLRRPHPPVGTERPQQ